MTQEVSKQSIRRLLADDVEDHMMATCVARLQNFPPMNFQMFILVFMSNFYTQKKQ